MAYFEYVVYCEGGCDDGPGGPGEDAGIIRALDSQDAERRLYADGCLHCGAAVTVDFITPAVRVQS